MPDPPARSGGLLPGHRSDREDSRAIRARPIEREAKFDVDDAFVVPDLHAVAGPVLVDELGPVELVATYYDTDDLRLLARGVTLRHRVGERTPSGPQGQGLWTLKLPVAASGPTLDRREVVWPGPLDHLPARAVELTAGLRRRRPLQEAAVLTTVRRRIVVRSPDGRPLAEVDDDVVSQAGSIESFRQIEVELTGEGAGEGDGSEEVGDVVLVDAIGRLLRRAGARRAAKTPKVHRILISGSPAAATKPNTRSPLTRESTLDEVAAFAIGSTLDVLLAQDPAVRLGEDPEAVHKTRVAIRRLRAHLLLLGAVLDEGWVTRTRFELRWLAGALGRVRDVDVLAIQLEADRGLIDPSDRDAVDRLGLRLADERQDAARDLDRIMSSGGYLDLVDQLVAAAEAAPWRSSPSGSGADRAGTGERAKKADKGGRAGGLVPSAPARVILPRLLRKPWRATNAGAGAVGARQSGEELHELRKRAKRLRDDAELAAPVLGSQVARVAKAATALQAVLGEHHDAVVMERWLRVVGRHDQRVAFAAGQLVAAQQARQQEAQRAWRPAWSKLDNKRVRAALR